MRSGVVTIYPPFFLYCWQCFLPVIILYHLTERKKTALTAKYTVLCTQKMRKKDCKKAQLEIFNSPCVLPVV